MDKTGLSHALAALLLMAGATAGGAAEPDAMYGARPGRSAGDTALVRRGTDTFVGSGTASAGVPAGGPVTLNLFDVPVAAAAKAVLTDTFGWSYTLDERVGGTVTLQTGGPVRREQVLGMFESALASRGAVLRRRGSAVQIVPAGGPPGAQPVRSMPDLAGEPGSRALAVPLRWISAAEMQSILAAVAPREVVLRVDKTRNMLILSGDSAQIDALRETIAVFDVDWMRGMSTAVVPVRSSNPAGISRGLSDIFGAEAAGPGAVIRFVPNDALSAILVVTSRAAYLDRARDWIAQLESMAAARERQLFVYRIQNRSARELAGVLQGVVAIEMGAAVGGMPYGGGGGAPYGGAGGNLANPAGAASGQDPSGFGGGWGGAGGAPAPFGSTGAGYGGAPAANGGGAFGASPGGDAFGGGASGGMGGAGGMGMQPNGGPAAVQNTAFGQQTGAPGGAAGYANAGFGNAGPGGIDPTGMSGPNLRREAAIGIVADDSNNSLVISATSNQYEKILKILGRLDAMPTQVLLETVIAEVALNDSLEFGVQWFLKNGRSGFNLAQTATVAAASAATGGTAGLVAAATRGVPGFNYLLSGADFNVVLNALRGVTRVNVISSPNITVLDNRTAKLQVGDQVPIVRQSGQSALAAGAPILNQIELKDTGVILAVTPRVNKNGLVVLDINQEVSDVVPTTTSSINSPTIRQRRVATSVAVSDGHSLAIGGLVQEKAQITNESLPVLGDLPLIGAAFRNRVDARVRTELIVFIRPKVIRGTAEADGVASEFRAQVRAMMPVRPVPPPPPLPALQPGFAGLRQRMLD